MKILIIGLIMVSGMSINSQKKNCFAVFQNQVERAAVIEATDTERCTGALYSGMCLYEVERAFNHAVNTAAINYGDCIT